MLFRSLIKARRNFHSLVADWLVEHSGERTEEVTGLIANHLERAGRLEEALVYLRRAGEAIQFSSLGQAPAATAFQFLNIIR